MLEKLPEAVGHALRGERAGLDRLLFNRIDLRAGVARIEVSSLAFADHGPIPALYTADGEGISPPLAWKGLPDTTGSLALIVEDADSPTSEPLVHAIAVDIDPQLTGVTEGQLTSASGSAGPALHLGRNSYLQTAWLPPDPPPGHGVHRYAFQLFALIPGKPFSRSPGRHELVEAIEARAVASGCLIGTYQRDSRARVDRSEAIPDEALTGDTALVQ
jgi:Raf kinase inhibitor-like YbhB/YbcL family protein